LKLGLMTTPAAQPTLIPGRGLELKELGQGGGPRLMKRPAQGGLDRFQVGSTVLAPLGKDLVEELIYFPRHLLMDRKSRFFSCSVQPPRCGSTGRKRQILALRAISSWLSFWKRRNSATSC
jgi:hypothetical protein